MLNLLADWEQYTQRLTEFFISYYFGKADWYWIGDEVGGTIEVNNYFFNIGDIVDFLRYKYSKKELFDFYDEMAENNYERKASIKHWKELKKLKKI